MQETLVAKTDVKRQIYNYLMENYIQEEFAFAQPETTAIQKFEVFKVFECKINIPC